LPLSVDGLFRPRLFSPTDTSLSYPNQDWIIPAWLDGVLTLAIPFAVYIPSQF
jgi:hypothetical protein